MRNKKLGFLSMIFAVAFLASCESTDTTDDTTGTGSLNADDTTGAVSTPITGEDLTGEDLPTEDAATQTLADLEAMYTVYYFEFDSAALSQDTKDALDVVAGILQASGETVVLEGHADERGTTEYNLQLGKKRAQRVEQYLVAQGVDSSQLVIKSAGEMKPAVEGSNEAAWAKNRRVELIR